MGVFRRVMLCELEPQAWGYSSPNPDKSRWVCEAHYARFSIQLQIVRRRLSHIPPGPLPWNRRLEDIGFDLKLAEMMWKMEGVHETFRPPVAEIVEG
jgi:hypothetical protein